MFHNIPDELKALRQWVNWSSVRREDGTNTKVPLRSIDGKRASAIDPRDWSTFDRAVAMAAQCDGIGFVFTKSDPYVGIDLDAAKTEEVKARQLEIYRTINSYSEYSPSGNGLHIIARAQLSGAGRRRNSVEVYDNARFFTFTGNVVYQAPIADRHAEVTALYETLGVADFSTLYVASQPQTDDDLTVYNKAATAANGIKFETLWRGDWQAYYANLSQSEADFALINIIAFYTKNKPQIMRMFRQSGLGQRDKAKRDAYLNYMINKSFDRMPTPADLDSMRNARVAMLAELGIEVR